MDSATSSPTLTRENASDRLHAAVRDLSDPLQVMQRIVDETLQVVSPAEGAVVELVEDGELVFVSCSGSLAPHVGVRTPVGMSLSGSVAESGEPLWERVSERELCARTGVRSLVSLPLVSGGRTVGVFSVTSGRAGAFDEDDVATLARLSEFVAVIVATSTDLKRAIGSAFGGDGSFRHDGHSDELAISQFVANVLSPDVGHNVAVRERITRVIEECAFTSVFQPIIEISSGRMVAVEALTRFSDQSEATPDRWFHTAHSVGLGPELELAVLRPALARLDDLPADCRMAINLGPDAIVCPDLIAFLITLDLDRVIVELTEHVEVADYPELRRNLQMLRDRGITVAIDDTGAGFSSLSHVLKLAPDVIKLDLELTRGIDSDPVRRSLALNLVGFARDTGAAVIAEGIETEGELETLRSIGIAYGQGYLLGRPAPFEALCAKRRSWSRVFSLKTRLARSTDTAVVTGS